MERVCVITGANTGIGKVSAERIAQAGFHVFLCGRSEERTMSVVHGIRAAGGNADFVALDLGDLEQVRSATEELRSRVGVIDLMINNAGIGGSRALSKQGFELNFAVNHLGHFLWSMELMPLLFESDAPRLVQVASRAHYRARRTDLAKLQERAPKWFPMRAYCFSKLCNVLFVSEMLRRIEHPGLFACSLHPGVVATDIWRRLPDPLERLAKSRMITPEQGAQTTLHCALSAEALEHQGAYFDASAPKRAGKLARDQAYAAQLWQKSVEWTGSDLPASSF